MDMDWIGTWVLWVVEHWESLVGLVAFVVSSAVAGWQYVRARNYRGIVEIAADVVARKDSFVTLVNDLPAEKIDGAAEVVAERVQEQVKQAFYAQALVMGKEPVLAPIAEAANAREQFRLQWMEQVNAANESMELGS